MHWRGYTHAERQKRPGRGGGTLASPAAPSPLGTPKPPGAQFRGAKWTFQSRPQGRPPKGPSAQPRTPGAGRRPRTTPECHLTPYNSVSGPSMVIFWRTGVHQKTHMLVTFSPLGVPLGGPGWGGGAHQPPMGHPGPAQAQPGQNGPGSHLDTPNGAFKVGPNVGHRRLQV